MVFYVCHTSLLIITSNNNNLIIINNDLNVEKHYIIISMMASIYFVGRASPC